MPPRQRRSMCCLEPALKFAKMSLWGASISPMHDESLEGWYTDPYERHEVRWLSQGTPTSFVRDGGTEGNNPVEDAPFKVTPVRIEIEGPGDGSDRLRADDAQSEDPYDSQEASRAATDVFDPSPKWCVATSSSLWQIAEPHASQLPNCRIPVSPSRCAAHAQTIHPGHPSEREPPGGVKECLRPSCGDGSRDQLAFAAWSPIWSRHN
jgi:hypothetical protein